MDHPIQSETNKKSTSQSMQIIIPYNELKRNNDMFILQLSSNNRVCPEGFYVALISTIVENYENPEKDLEYGINMLGSIIEKFVSISDMFEPNNNSDHENCFVTNSYDSATHFENTAIHILDLFEKINNKLSG